MSDATPIRRAARARAADIRILALLRDLEWSGEIGGAAGTGRACCPCCFSWDEHRRNCRMAAAIAAARGEPA